MRHRVLVCDARPLVRLGLATAIARERDLSVHTASGACADLIDVVGHARPQLVIVDTRSLPQGALVLVPNFCARFPEIQLLVLCDDAEPLLAAELLRAGAAGVIHSAQTVVEILDAIRTTLRGACYLPPSLDAADVEHALRDSPIQALTRREREIFVLLGRGLSNAAIAQQLFISLRTVETHRQRVIAKLGVHSLAELVRIAVTLELAGWTPASRANPIGSS